MPLAGMRPSMHLTKSRPLSHLTCLQQFSKFTTFCDLLLIPKLEVRKPVRLCVSSFSQLVSCRERASIWFSPATYHISGNSERRQKQSLLTTLSNFRLYKKGIGSGRRQAQVQGDAGTAPPSSYKTLARPHTFSLEVKKSKFIAAAAPVDDEAAALSFLSQVRDTRASHNCWAFKIGDRTRLSDDGEPGGTAGRPMLAAITSAGIDHVMVIVTRFFGGTKLGTGGLVRAYGKVTMDCLKDTDTIIVKTKVSLKLRSPYDVLGALYPLLQTYGVDKLDENFDTEGEGGVTMNLTVDAENLWLLERDLKLASKGRASVSDVCS